MDANKVIKDIIDFIHKEEDDFFVGKKIKICSSLKEDILVKFLEVHSDAFIFKLNVEGFRITLKKEICIFYT